MGNRLDSREKVTNAEETYKEILEERGVKRIIQYASPNMIHPTAEQIGRLAQVPHVWSHGDRFYKLAYEHYGHSEWWWVIAWYNQMPTESHVEIGQVIQIPKPLDRVLRYMRG
tara:strand:- start:119 stop:457 length:339 start_codon:yes stop_codon:yes gene_type:complete